MLDVIEIKGGATEFEAAVIAVVLDQVVNERAIKPSRQNEVSPWVRAIHPLRSGPPIEAIRPR
jgi:hypothetical protein